MISCFRLCVSAAFQESVASSAYPLLLVVILAIVTSYHVVANPLTPFSHPTVAPLPANRTLFQLK